MKQFVLDCVVHTGAGPFKDVQLRFDGTTKTMTRDRQKCGWVLAIGVTAKDCQGLFQEDMKTGDQGCSEQYCTHSPTIPRLPSFADMRHAVKKFCALMRE